MLKHRLGGGCACDEGQVWIMLGRETPTDTEQVNVEQIIYIEVSHPYANVNRVPIAWDIASLVG